MSVEMRSTTSVISFFFMRTPSRSKGLRLRGTAFVSTLVGSTAGAADIHEAIQQIEPERGPDRDGDGGENPPDAVRPNHVSQPGPKPLGRCAPSGVAAVMLPIFGPPG